MRLEDKLKRNIELNHHCKELKQLIEEEISSYSEEEQQKIWCRLLKGVTPPKETDKVTTAPMGYNEARRWYRSEKIEFGKYKGNFLIDIPTEYLMWLDAQPDFRVQLHKFLMSDYWNTTHGKATD
jgi:hypothetical protein